MSDSSDRKGWRPGYTHGTSEGNWSRVDSGLAKYERRGPITYGSPTSSEYADGWERIFGGGKAKQPTEVLCGKPLPAEGGVFPCQRPAGHPDGEHGL